MIVRHSLILALCLFCGGLSFAKPDREPYQGTFDRSSILVKVEYYSHWSRPTVAAMDCSGKIKVVGVFSDTTAVTVFVKPETAVSLINGLLEVDFFGLQQTYRAMKGTLVPKDENTIEVGAVVSVDGGANKVTVYVGEKSHTVSLQYPAFGAPPELKSFVVEFKELVRQVHGRQQ